MMLTICFLAILQTSLKSPQSQPTTLQATDAWKTVITKTGISLSLPIDLGKPVLQGTAATNPFSEEYSPKSWPGCSLKLSRQAFGKEDARDSVAVKLEDVVYNDLDLSEDRITAVAFGIRQGWPEATIEGLHKDGSAFRYLVCRTKALYFVMTLSGKELPASETVRQFSESVKLPKDVAGGNWTKLGFDEEKATFENGRVEVWSPIKFVDTDDYPDFNDDEVTGEAHEGEFGYTTYKVAIVNLLPGMEDKLDDAGIDHLIHSMFDEDEEGDKVTYGEFRTFTIDKIEFRSVTYVNDSIEGRIDVAAITNKLYLFSAVVPRGMLDSTAAKRFFSSIKIH